jgi:hypothetical protein
LKETMPVVLFVTGSHDVDPKIVLASQEAELTLNKCIGNVMKRAIRMLLFVCLKTSSYLTQQTKDGLLLCPVNQLNVQPYLLWHNRTDSRPKKTSNVMKRKQNVLAQVDQ